MSGGYSWALIDFCGTEVKPFLNQLSVAVQQNIDKCFIVLEINEVEAQCLRAVTSCKTWAEQEWIFREAVHVETFSGSFLLPRLLLFTSSSALRGQHMSELSFSSCDSTAAATVVVKHPVPFSNAL